MNKIDWTSTDNTSKYGEITHHYMADTPILGIEDVNSVFVLAFNINRFSDYNMAITAIIRGSGSIGLPGGGVDDKKDKTIYDTAYRETLEETGASLIKGSLRIVRNIHSIPSNHHFEKDYMTIMTGYYEEITDDKQYREYQEKEKHVLGRKLFNKESDFTLNYNSGHTPSMVRMLSEAKQILFNREIPKNHNLSSLGLFPKP